MTKKRDHEPEAKATATATATTATSGHQARLSGGHKRAAARRKRSVKFAEPLAEQRLFEVAASPSKPKQSGSTISELEPPLSLVAHLDLAAEKLNARSVGPKNPPEQQPPPPPPPEQHQQQQQQQQQQSLRATKSSKSVVSLAAANQPESKSQGNKRTSNEHQT